MKWVFSTVGCKLLETALCHATAMDPQWKQKVALLEGKVIALELTDFSTTMVFIPGEQGLFVRPLPTSETDPCQSRETVDVFISGTIEGFLHLIDARRKAQQVVGGGVKFSGDVAVGQHFEKLLASLSPEWEASLSRIFGDAMTRLIVDSSHYFQQSFRKILSDFGTNVQDYVQQEAGLLPVQIELDNFAEDTAILRADVARMEARIKRLNAHLASKKATT